MPWFKRRSRRRAGEVEEVFDESFRQRLELLLLQAAKAAGSRREGLRLGTARGGQLEFADYRTYTAGDDLRYVDWNLFARHEKLFLKEFVREEAALVYVLVDGTESMLFPRAPQPGRPTKFTFVRRLAAGICYVALAGADEVSLAIAGQNRLHPLVERKTGRRVLAGRHRIHEIMAFLEGRDEHGRPLSPKERQWESGGTCRLKEIFELFLRGKRRPGAAIVLSDFWDEGNLEAALGLLVARNRDATLIRVLAPEEIAPPETDRYRVYDSESASELELDVGGEARRLYAEELNFHIQRLEAACHARGIRHLWCRSDEPLEGVLLRQLRLRDVVA